MKKIIITAAAAMMCLCSCGNSTGSESSSGFSKDYEKAFIDYVETYNSFDAAKEMKYLYLDSLIDQLNDDQRKTIEDTLRDDYDEFRSLIKKYGEDARLEITDIESEPLDAEALEAAKYFLCADYTMDSLKCDENSVSVSEGYEITAIKTHKLRLVWLTLRATAGKYSTAGPPSSSARLVRQKSPLRQKEQQNETFNSYRACTYHDRCGVL